MAITPGERDLQPDQHFEQQWREHLAYEMRTRLALEEQQKEEVQSYLY